MAQSAPIQRPDLHLHVDAALCPTCEQPVPNEKLAEIGARLEAQEREVSSRLARDFENRMNQAQQAAKAELLKVANDNAAEVQKIKADAAKREIAAREAAKAEVEAQLKDQLAEAARLRLEAEQARAASKVELERVRHDHDAAITRLKQEAATREENARNEARVKAELQYSGQLTEIAQKQKDAEVLAAATAQELQRQKSESLATIESLKQKEANARIEGKAEGELAASAQITELTQKNQSVETQLQTLAANNQARLDEQRASLEKARDEAVNAEKSKAFDDKLKMETQLKEMARKLEQKTADELGEGAEIKLLDELQEKFQGDKFHHVGKGNAGADIIQEVIHNGKACGKIIYDSKNRGAWRNEYISKLRKDQVAAEADHAILSSLAFPAGAKQMHLQDGVLIVNPARVLTLVELLREQVIRNYKLRLSNESKTEKTAALYTFITGEMSAQLFKQIETNAADILDLDVKEKKAHENIWKRRGELARSIQKAHGDLSTHIELVLGTASNESNTED